MVTSRWTGWITTAAVLLLALIAAVVSYSHMYELALRHGEPAWRATMFPRPAVGFCGDSSPVGTIVMRGLARLWGRHVP
jgi:hypothetical protein